MQWLINLWRKLLRRHKKLSWGERMFIELEEAKNSNKPQATPLSPPQQNRDGLQDFGLTDPDKSILPDMSLLQTGALTKPRALDDMQVQWQVGRYSTTMPMPTVQLELPLKQPIHLKNRTKLLATELTRLKMRKPLPKREEDLVEPREVSEPSGVSIPSVDDPTAIIEVRNELTGQAWRFKDIGSMYGPDGTFALRGQWPPGLYRIENRTKAGLKLTLWNETHAIEPGETWRFFAHSELGRKAELIERRRMN